MELGQFIWADLSTYNTEKSIQFYKKVFGWKISDLQNYHLAQVNSFPVAGIFETPAFLQKIKMPHFWMSYFQVKSTEKAVAVAENLGAKIEVKPTDFNNGKIALIRDPQGAGFSVYDGEELNLPKNKVHGTIIKTELHVSNVENIIPFYNALFDWNLTKISEDIYQPKPATYQSQTLIKKIDNTLKGKYEYWATSILVDNLEATTKTIIENGGQVIVNEEGRNMMSDNSEEAFFYLESIIN